MNFIERYKAIGLATEEDVFGYLLANLKDTIKTYDFYVAWSKVVNNVRNIEISLNILNSLIGKSNIKQEFFELIKSYPQVVPVIPILIACREKTLKVAEVGGDIVYHFQKECSYTDKEVSSIVNFAEKCGILDLLANKTIKNLVDYCIGVEVGIDTNARKNRSGTAMEGIVEVYIRKICEENGFDYLAQATAASIKTKFNKDVPTDKSSRKFDFAINTSSKIYILETNYYSGGGSKLKSVCGEFKSLYTLLNTKKDLEFIWITDGLGWHTAKLPLRETFNSIDYVVNLKMVEEGILQEIISNNL